VKKALKVGSNKALLPRISDKTGKEGRSMKKEWEAVVMRKDRFKKMSNRHDRS
jgi:hypothetical protein